MNRKILEGDALEKLKEIDDNSIDLIATDPPYGYSFMNKDWDKAVVKTEIWKECLRVLKPGSFAFVMSAPRQDVLSHMIVNLTNAGFKTDFTSIYWAYGTGFPKAMNISKAVDKKLGQKRNQITSTGNLHENSISHGWSLQDKHDQYMMSDENPISEQAKKLNGSYAGFQPKPAVEVILVCMKPLSKKNYVEQALDNGKGVTWFDDCRIPYKDEKDVGDPNRGKGYPLLDENKGWNQNNLKNNITIGEKGRFPANLIVSDNVLDEGDFSRYFSLDSWEAQFIITPKPSKSEKNKGLDNFIEKKVNDGRKIDADNAFQRGKTKRKNIHPTVKPVSLFKYLITLGSRSNDFVLDPFMGSGTTAIACEKLARNWIGIELDPTFCKIIQARIDLYLNSKIVDFT